MLAIFCSVLVISVNGQEDFALEGQNCTSIMVGRKATTDGSVITSHTCDSRYRTWVTMEPAADHAEGAMHKVYKGTMHTGSQRGMEGVTLMGEIPEAAHTYAYMNTAYPCMNEKQLAMGESTFSGPDTLVSDKGLFYVEELQRVLLQRCDNARDAIRLMGELVEKYGYADGGECITIADRQEVWQVEVMGAGKGHAGGIWAAQRVPDDEVAVSCNVPRIGRLDRRHPDRFLCSDNVEEVARQHGLWDGKSEFVWWKVFTGDYGRDKNHNEREWYIFNELAPSLHLSIDSAELPFSVRPEKKVSPQDVMRLFRANYEGSPLDLTQNLLFPRKYKDEDGNTVEDTIVNPSANPWMGGYEENLYNYLKPGTVKFYRGIAMSWCSYSTVIQCRDWLPDEIGGLCWLSLENPGESPRIPVYAGQTRMPAGFEICGHLRYNDEAALWQYRKANKLAQINWGLTKGPLMKQVMYFEDKGFAETPALEKEVAKLLKDGKKDEAQLKLNRYCRDFAAATRQAWADLEHRFWEMFWISF